MQDTKVLFTTDAVYCPWLIGAEMCINETLEDGLEFEFEGQRNGLSFTLYRDGVKELRDFLDRWLED